MNELMPPLLWSDAEIAELRRAKTLLEQPGLAARLAHAVGTPIEQGFRLLPQGWAVTVQRAAHRALTKALDVAVRTLDDAPSAAAAEAKHQLLVGVSGGVGGAFGLAALPLELPISTTLMLRSIAEIARSEGHSPRAVSTKLACLEVFALGGRSTADDAAENAYWAVRTTLALAMAEATKYLARGGLVEEGAPALVRLIAAIAARFGLIVSEQAAAKAIPVVGAAAGAAINVIFLDHFQRMARGHFIVKRLEARHGTEAVQRLYESLAVRM
jgi:hypothetical protein